MNSVPVFMYHHVSPNKGDTVTVTPEVFDEQMRFLRKAGYKTLSADELVAFAEGNLPVKEKAVAITFDDGYLDNYVYAFPALKRYQIKAAIFIVADWVEEASLNTVRSQESGVRSQEMVIPSHNESKHLIANGQANRVIMNWGMIREMQDSGLVNFYSHTVTHRKCAELSQPELIQELQGSKAIIEQRLNKPCLYLCWPQGSHNETSVEMAKKAGYKALFVTKKGVVAAGSDVFSVGRVVAKDSVEWFKGRVKIYTSPLLSRIYLAVRGNR